LRKKVPRRARCIPAFAVRTIFFFFFFPPFFLTPYFFFCSSGPHEQDRVSERERRVRADENALFPAFFFFFFSCYPLFFFFLSIRCLHSTLPSSKNEDRTYFRTTSIPRSLFFFFFFLFSSFPPFFFFLLSCFLFSSSCLDRVLEG